MRIKVLDDQHFVIKDDDNRTTIKVDAYNAGWKFRAIRHVLTNHEKKIHNLNSKIDNVLSSKMSKESDNTSLPLLPVDDIQGLPVIITGQIFYGNVQCRNYTLKHADLIYGDVNKDKKPNFENFLAPSRKIVIDDVNELTKSPQFTHPQRFPHLLPKLQHLQAKLHRYEANANAIGDIKDEISSLRR